MKSEFLSLSADERSQWVADNVENARDYSNVVRNGEEAMPETPMFRLGANSHVVMTAYQAQLDGEVPGVYLVLETHEAHPLTGTHAVYMSPMTESDLMTVNMHYGQNEGYVGTVIDMTNNLIAPVYFHPAAQIAPDMAVGRAAGLSRADVLSKSPYQSQVEFLSRFEDLGTGVGIKVKQLVGIEGNQFQNYSFDPDVDPSFVEESGEGKDGMYDSEGERLWGSVVSGICVPENNPYYNVDNPLTSGQSAELEKVVRGTLNQTLSQTVSEKIESDLRDFITDKFPDVMSLSRSEMMAQINESHYSDLLDVLRRNTWELDGGLTPLIMDELLANDWPDEVYDYLESSIDAYGDNIVSSIILEDWVQSTLNLSILEVQSDNFDLADTNTKLDQVTEIVSESQQTVADLQKKLDEASSEEEQDELEKELEDAQEELDDQLEEKSRLDEQLSDLSKTDTHTELVDEYSQEQKESRENPWDVAPE